MALCACVSLLSLNVLLNPDIGSRYWWEKSGVKVRSQKCKDNYSPVVWEIFNGRGRK